MSGMDLLDWVGITLGIGSILFTIAGVALSGLILFVGNQIRQAVAKEEEQLNKRIDEKVKEHIKEIRKVGEEERKKMTSGDLEEIWKKKGGKDGEQ